MKIKIAKTKLSLSNYTLIKFSPKFYRIPKLLIEPELNVFSQIKILEKDHSKILGNLLNPKGTHGYKNLFLNNFFKIFVPDMEINDNDYWIITVEKEGRYDIRIRNRDNSKIIIIENKSGDATDGKNQLYRYWFKGLYTAQFNRKLHGLECFAKIIYLSPADYKAPDNQTQLRPSDFPADYPEKVPSELVNIAFFNNQVLAWLDLCINAVDKNTNVYYYLIQYRDFWRYKDVKRYFTTG